MQKILELQERVKTLQALGYELLQSDEAVFSVDAYVQRHWAPKGNPIRKDCRWNNAKPVVVFGVISPTRGVVHWHFGWSSFTADDICDALEEVRAKIGAGVKLAMMWDNAQIHRAKKVKKLIATPEVDIEPVWNVAARPELATVGQEQCWARLKFIYRSHVDRYKALNQPFNHMGLVQSVVGHITDEYAKRLAAHSIPAVMAAQPIAPLPNEQMRDEFGRQYVMHSPRKQDVGELNFATFD